MVDSKLRQGNQWLTEQFVDAPHGVVERPDDAGALFIEVFVLLLDARQILGGAIGTWRRSRSGTGIIQGARCAVVASAARCPAWRR